MDSIIKCIVSIVTKYHPPKSEALTVMITISVSAKARNARKLQYCRRNQGKSNDTGLLTAYKFTKILLAPWEYK